MSKDIKEYLINDATGRVPTLKRFANTKNINKKLDSLKSMAEPELWTIGKFKNDLLYNYVFCIFDMAVQQGLVYINNNENEAIFNTGLLTLNGQDIYGRFVINTDARFAQFWSLENFYKDSNRYVMESFNKFPDFIEYFENPKDAYYDCSLNLHKELDHIIDDNFERLPIELQSMLPDDLRHIIDGSINTSLKRIKRNNRLVAPQIYFGKLMYLLPVDLIGKKYALAVEKINNQYRASTILTVEMAYMQARLVMKPEVNWLIPSNLDIQTI